LLLYFWLPLVTPLTRQLFIFCNRNDNPIYIKKKKWFSLTKTTSLNVSHPVETYRPYRGWETKLQTLPESEGICLQKWFSSFQVYKPHTAIQTYIHFCTVSIITYMYLDVYEWTLQTTIVILSRRKHKRRTSFTRTIIKYILYALEQYYTEWTYYYTLGHTSCSQL